MANQVQVKAEEGKQEIFIEREFNAPRELLFKAFTDPEIIPQWWGSTSVEKMDAKTEGSWKFNATFENGYKVTSRGIYHEVKSPEKIIETYEMEGMAPVLLQISQFEELPEGRSKLTMHQVYQSVDDRDKILHSGLEKGVQYTYQKLEELLEKIKGKN